MPRNRAGSPGFPASFPPAADRDATRADRRSSGSPGPPSLRPKIFRRRTTPLPRYAPTATGSIRRLPWLQRLPAGLATSPALPSRSSFVVPATPNLRAGPPIQTSREDTRPTTSWRGGREVATGATTDSGRGTQGNLIGGTPGPARTPPGGAPG